MRLRQSRQACGQSAAARIAAVDDTSARREQRDGQDTLLRRHTAMKEGTAIAALILAKLRRIHEERVACREKRVRAKTAAWQLECILIRKSQSVVWILGPKVSPELVPQIGCRVA